MQADGDVLLDAVVEGCRLPIVQEEDHGHCLTEVVQLQAGCADRGEDAGVGNRAGGDGEFAGAEDEVGVCRGSAEWSDTIEATHWEFVPEWISYYEECDIDLVCILEDIVAGRLDHLTVSYDDFAAIERLLLS